MRVSFHLWQGTFSCWFHSFLFAVMGGIVVVSVIVDVSPALFEVLLLLSAFYSSSETLRRERHQQHVALHNPHSPSLHNRKEDDSI